MKVVKTNNQGWQLVNGNWWSIIRPNGNGTNSVAHVGQEKHVKKMWNERFCKIVQRNDMGLLEVIGTDSSLRV